MHNTEPNTPSKGRLLGYLLIASNDQDQIIASSWDDADAKKWNRKAVLKWLRRGLTVRRIERYEADPMPIEWFAGTPLAETFISSIPKHVYIDGDGVTHSHGGE